MKKEKDHHGNRAGIHDHQGYSATANVKVAFCLNLGFTLVEIAGGIFTNSVAIISSALHDLGDSFSLGLSWYFQHIAKKTGDYYYTYGYKRFSVLGAVMNSCVLVIGSIFVLHETLPRLFNPESMNVPGMMVLALVGIAVNGTAVLRLKRGSSLNEKVVSLHLLEDVLGWAAIFLGSLVMTFAALPVLDPILSILITLFVLFNVFKNLRLSMRIFLQAVPVDTHIGSIKEKILSVPGTVDAHDIHSWSMDGEYNILSMHLVLEESTSPGEIKKIKNKVKNLLKSLKIDHVTVETEFTGDCRVITADARQKNCIEEMAVES